MFMTEILKPLVRRLGTVFGGFFIGYGVPADDAEAIAVGIVAALLVGIDLLQSHLDRKGSR